MFFRDNFIAAVTSPYSSTHLFLKHGNGEYILRSPDLRSKNNPRNKFNSLQTSKLPGRNHIGQDQVFYRLEFEEFCHVCMFICEILLLDDGAEGGFGGDDDGYWFGL